MRKVIPCSTPPWLEHAWETEGECSRGWVLAEWGLPEAEPSARAGADTTLSGKDLQRHDLERRAQGPLRASANSTVGFSPQPLAMLGHTF